MVVVISDGWGGFLFSTAGRCKCLLGFIYFIFLVCVFLFFACCPFRFRVALKVVRETPVDPVYASKAGEINDNITNYWVTFRDLATSHEPVGDTRERSHGNGTDQ